jgi:hypothetical protein
MRRRWKSATTWASLALAISAVRPALASPISAQINDFNDGAAQGWTNGGALGSISIATGGPAGAADPFLRVTSNGGFGSGSKMVFFNRTVQWTGDYSAAPIASVEMDLKNLGSSALNMRIAVKNNTSSSAAAYATTTAFDLSNDGQWHHAVFGLSAADLTQVSGSSSLPDILASVAEFRILSFTSPSAFGDTLDAVLGVDNITAVSPPPPAPPEWNVNGGGSWNDPNSWTTGIPNAPGATAKLLAKPEAPANVTLDANITIGRLTFDNTNAYTLSPGAGGTLKLAGDTGPAEINVLSGSHTIAAPLVIATDTNLAVSSGATLNISQAPLAIAAGSTLTKSGPGLLDVTSSIAPEVGATFAAAAGSVSTANIRGAALVIHAGALVTIKPNGTSVGVSNLAALTFDGSPDAWQGRLDLTDNDLIIQSNSANRDALLAQLTNQIKSARNTGSTPGTMWQGQGITTSAAALNPKGITGLAVIANDNGQGAKLYTLFDGQTVDETAILVKFTYNGDMDLNGKIDADDYFQIDRGFVGHLNGYRNGDLDYNGTIDADDYFLIDNAFANQSGALSATATQAVSSVPEPALLCPLLLAVSLLARRSMLRAAPPTSHRHS